MAGSNMNFKYSVNHNIGCLLCHSETKLMKINKMLEMLGNLLIEFDITGRSEHGACWTREWRGASCWDWTSVHQDWTTSESLQLTLLVPRAGQFDLLLSAGKSQKIHNLLCLFCKSWNYPTVRQLETLINTEGRSNLSYSRTFFSATGCYKNKYSIQMS